MPEPTELTEHLLEIASALRETADRVERAATTLALMATNKPPNDGPHGPTLDRKALTVTWNGTSCFLGYTTAFRLLERLAQRPNQYVSHAQLLDDVWGGSRSPSAIRSAVNDLRARLTSAGLEDLANSIDGRNPGHYGLIVRQA